MKSKKTLRPFTLTLSQTAMLSAVALILGVLENMIPDLPFMLPGMKLGLSNIAVMFSLQFCPLPGALCICVVKALFALLNRGVTSFFMSLCGGVFATLVMWLLLHVPKASFGSLGLGVGGAFAHNLGQLMVAYILVSDAVFTYGTILFLSAVVTGSVTGLLYHIVMPCLESVNRKYLSSFH